MENTMRTQVRADTSTLDLTPPLRGSYNPADDGMAYSLRMDRRFVLYLLNTLQKGIDERRTGGLAYALVDVLNQLLDDEA